MLNMLDDLDAKMQIMQDEFARHKAAGGEGARMTDWVRAMERPLLDTSRYLEESVPAQDEAATEDKDAIPAED